MNCTRNFRVFQLSGPAWQDLQNAPILKLIYVFRCT